MSQIIQLDRRSDSALSSMREIAIDRLHPHPKNPRLFQREEVIAQIAAGLANGFAPAHALIVRPLGSSDWQIVAGHHRYEAAKRAGLQSVPCWVHDLDDDAAYLLLITSNAQSELTPLERGMHALNSGMDIKAYAASVGRARTTVQDEVKAARVAATVTDIRHGDFQTLVAIHVAPEWLWPAMVEAMVAENWTVERTRDRVARLKGVPEPPQWTDVATIAAAVMDGRLPSADVAKFASAVEQTIATLLRNEERAEIYRAQLVEQLASAKPSRLSMVQQLCRNIETKQTDAIREQTRRQEESRERTSRLRRNASLEEWKTLPEHDHETLLHLEDAQGVNFNKQESDAIEWAMWSWNPVTGCEHTCPYCYAREIATSSKMARVYPYGFKPTLRPSMLLAPRYMKVPLEAKKDERYRNVFTCSMADLFGRWVPPEWIEAVLREIRAAPQWNFLCLTKFPKRMAEFDIPENCWMGTTVDLQARVNAAEEAFANVHSKVRWLSCEPLIEPLKFKHLDRFDWIVIGGASKTQETPEWRPPSDWIEDLKRQARNANLAIYEKTNLWGARTLELPFDAPIVGEPTVAPAVFHYLGKGN